MSLFLDSSLSYSLTSLGLSKSDSILHFEDDNSSYTGIKSDHKEGEIEEDQEHIEDLKNLELDSKSQTHTGQDQDQEHDQEQEQEKIQNQNQNKNLKEKSKDQQTFSTSSLESDEEKKQDKEKVETIFKWEEGGNTVLVTGSFCNWKQFFIMTKNENGINSLTLTLPRGLHQYKFKIDDVWKYSEKYPKMSDGNGNINNYIDTTKSKNTQKKYKKRKGSFITKDTGEIGITPKITLKNSSSTKSLGIKRPQDNYNLCYPSKEDLREEPPLTPGLYKSVLDLSKSANIDKSRKNKQEKGIHKFFAKHSKNKDDDENNNYKNNNNNSISDLFHIHFNHLNSKKNYKKDKAVISSIISRFRLKSTTFIYYKPYYKQQKKIKTKAVQFK